MILSVPYGSKNAWIKKYKFRYTFCFCYCRTASKPASNFCQCDLKIRKRSMKKGLKEVKELVLFLVVFLPSFFCIFVTVLEKKFKLSCRPSVWCWIKRWCIFTCVATAATQCGWQQHAAQGLWTCFWTGSALKKWQNRWGGILCSASIKENWRAGDMSQLLSVWAAFPFFFNCSVVVGMK